MFQLQRRVSGVEVAVGGFFNGKNFIYPINVNFEHKKLFPGDIGPPTGEMGTAMFWSGPINYSINTLLKMEPVLASEGYVGYIDLNCIVNNNGIYPLEFTSRFRLSHHQHSAGRDVDAHRAIFSGPGGWQRSQIENAQRLPDRRAHRGAAISVCDD